MRSWPGGNTLAGPNRRQTERERSEGGGNASSEPTVAKRPPALPPEATLGAIVDWLRSAHVQGLIIGGIAASLLGRPRMTRDVDGLFLLDEDFFERFFHPR